MTAPTENPPSIGRIVHVVLDNGHGGTVIRPAIIVATFKDQKGAVASYVNVLVFTDGENDTKAAAAHFKSHGGHTIWLSSVPHSPDQTKVRTWHWPWEAT